MISSEVRVVGPAWLGAGAAVIVAIPVAAKITQQVWVSGSPWKRQRRRKLACLRMAEQFAANSSQGYPEHYGRYLEHFLGGREWSDGWGTDRWEDTERPDTFD
jgi:hypothetical protein